MPENNLYNLETYTTVHVVLEVEVKLTPEVIEAFEENGDHDMFMMDIKEHYSEQSLGQIPEWENNNWCEPEEIKLSHRWSVQGN